MNPPSDSKALDRFRLALIGMQAGIRRCIRTQISRAEAGSLSQVREESPSDTIYAIDRDCESILLDHLNALARDFPIVVIAEGVHGDEPLPLPEGTREEECRYRILVDPIDGTRMLMYDKRAAWSLAGVAPNRGPGTTLADIELAVMSELPTSKQICADTIWATRDSGTRGWRENLSHGSRRAWRPTPSRATDLSHGFAQFTKFFLGRKPLLAELEEEAFKALGAFEKEGRCLVFEDQYLSTGGQIYELLAGHDRFQADLRAAVRRLNQPDSPPPGMACHPYDICVELIAREAGIEVTDLEGNRLACSLDTTSEVDWIAYANPEIRARLAPVLGRVFREHGLV